MTDTNNTVAILQARMSSSRLPGKILMEVCGKPLLQLQIERLRRCTSFDRLVVATSTMPDDSKVEELCSRLGVSCFRGALDDVLERFYQCAVLHDAAHVVRLTGDCPLADPALIDDLVRFYRCQKVDYASNARPPSLPDGLDAEIFSFAALEEAQRSAVGAHAREHVVPYIIQNPQLFTSANWTNPTDLSGLRWTVDEPEDFEFVRQVYEALYNDNRGFDHTDILHLLEKRPELATVNTRFERNAGSRRK